MNFASDLIAASKANSRLRAAWDKAGPGEKGRLAAAGSPFDTQLSNAAYEFMSDIGSLLPQAMRFELTDSVMQAIIKMGGNKDIEKDLCPALDHARPPHPLTWLEWKLSGKNEGYGGILIEEDREHGEIRIRGLSRKQSGGQAEYSIVGEAVILKEGIVPREGLSDMFGLEGPGKYRQGMIGISALALCTLLLLNSRSQILKAGPEQDVRKINEKNARKGKPLLHPVRTITFDTSRVVKQNPGLSRQGAEELMARTLVTGHFKIRKTGIFWWSSYPRRVRGNPDDPLIKDRILDRKNPGAPAYQVDGKKLLKGTGPKP